jgi:hypothetical protein
VTPLAEAQRMLDAFASIGATYFDVTFLDIDGGKRGFRPQQTAGQLRNSLPRLLPGLTARHQSMVIRPHSGVTTVSQNGDSRYRENRTADLGHPYLIQLDDLKAEALGRVSDAAFLTIQTSPGNHQAWVAVSGLTSREETKEFARRLRKGVGADPSASGATRVAGTTNYKRKYAPEFPAVSIVETHPGRVMTPEQLDSLGLLAPPEPAPAVLPFKTSRTHTRSQGARTWPDYQRSLAGAPPNRDGTGPDRSMADFFWCMMAAQRGWSIEDTAAKLLEVSAGTQERARLGDEGYALITAQNAAAAAERRGRGRA